MKRATAATIPGLASPSLIEEFFATRKSESEVAAIHKARAAAHAQRLARADIKPVDLPRNHTRAPPAKKPDQHWNRPANATNEETDDD
jgi:hypothetical protein